MRKSPLIPIQSNTALERIQLDLLDMRHEADGQYNWIIHVKDHFSKFSGLGALHKKEAAAVAEYLENV